MSASVLLYLIFLIILYRQKTVIATELLSVAIKNTDFLLFTIQEYPRIFFPMIPSYQFCHHPYFLKSVHTL